MLLTVSPEYKHLADFVSSLPSTFDDIGELIYAERNTLRKVSMPDGTVLCVKRYRRPLFVNRVVYSFFRPSKAERAYTNALTLQDKGIATAHAVAYLLCSEHGLLTDSYLVTLFCPYTRLMREYTLCYTPELEQVIRPFARFTAKIHSADVLPTDYSPGNILFERRAEGYDFCLVDINRMEFRRVDLHSAAYSMRRICANRHFFEVFADEYSRLRGFDTELFLKALLHYRDRFWDYGKKANYDYD